MFKELERKELSEKELQIINGGISKSALAWWNKAGTIFNDTTAIYENIYR